jgi:hypothetical protein
LSIDSVGIVCSAFSNACAFSIEMLLLDAATSKRYPVGSANRKGRRHLLQQRQG